MRQRSQTSHPGHEFPKPPNRAGAPVALLYPSLLCFSLLCSSLLLTSFLICGCAHEESNTSAIRRDHAAISKLLDAALLSDDPRREFQSVLPRVREFPTVDSAWTDGTTFFVQYKQGGIVSWTAPPERKQ